MPPPKTATHSLGGTLLPQLGLYGNQTKVATTWPGSLTWYFTCIRLQPDGMRLCSRDPMRSSWYDRALFHAVLHIPTQETSHLFNLYEICFKECFIILRGIGIPPPLPYVGQKIDDEE